MKAGEIQLQARKAAIEAARRLVPGTVTSKMSFGLYERLLAELEAAWLAGYVQSFEDVKAELNGRLKQRRVRRRLFGEVK